LKKVENIFDLLNREKERQSWSLNLIASENYPSKNVLMALDSAAIFKYSEGIKTKYYNGCKYVLEIEEECSRLACEIFNCKYANVQPHSGTQANLAAILSLIKPGDKILSMNLKHGGHLSHGGSGLSLIDKIFKCVNYHLNEEEELDYESIYEIAKREKPNLIITGYSSFSRKINFEKFSKIAKSTGAFLLADIAHIAGLVAAGLHDSPFPFADIVTTTTHKTLRGPKGGMILTNDFELSKKINRNIFPGIQGGPICNAIAAKAVCLIEASSKKFVNYQTQVIKNAVALSNFLYEQDFRIVSKKTENHLFMIDLTKKSISGAQAANLLEDYNIVANKNLIPFDKLNGTETSGVRLGTPALTSRGMREKEMKIIGNLITLILSGNLTEKDNKHIKESIENLCRKFPIESLI